MRTVKLKGYIEFKSDPGGKREVEGFAFQVPGFEFFHSWATPHHYGGWTVSHWESGLACGTYDGVLSGTPKEAIKGFTKFIRAKGAKAVRQRLTDLGYLLR